MTSPSNSTIPHYHHAEGKLTPRQWRALYQAARTVGDRLSVSLLKHGQDRLVRMRLEDFNELMNVIERKCNT